MMLVGWFSTCDSKAFLVSFRSSPFESSDLCSMVLSMFGRRFLSMWSLMPPWNPALSLAFFRLTKSDVDCRGFSSRS